MRKSLTAALLAASLLPVAAQAQYAPRDHDGQYQERRDDRREVRDDRRDLRNDRRDLREDRRDLRDDRNREWRRDDWRGYRDQNRDLYRGQGWRSDFRYQAFRPGIRIALPYYGPRYVIADPWRYHLPRPGYNQRWVRHYNDVLLVDVRRGIVIDVIRNLYF